VVCWLDGGTSSASTLGPLGYECAQHRRTPRPSVDGTRSKALCPFGSQQRISRISPTDGRFRRLEWFGGLRRTRIPVNHPLFRIAAEDQGEMHGKRSGCKKVGFLLSCTRQSWKCRPRTLWYPYLGSLGAGQGRRVFLLASKPCTSPSPVHALNSCVLGFEV